MQCVARSFSAGITTKRRDKWTRKCRRRSKHKLSLPAQLQLQQLHLLLLPASGALTSAIDMLSL